MMRCQSHVILVVCFVMAVCAYATADVRSRLYCDPEQNMAPNGKVEVSSAAGAPGDKYGMAALNDTDATTRWATGSNAGVPQWIKFTFDDPVTLDTLVLLVVGEGHLYANWQTVQVEFSDGENATFDLEDRAGAHILRVSPRTVRWFKITLLEDYGQKTCYGLQPQFCLPHP